MWDSVIKNALNEDIGWGDITTELTVSDDMRSVGNFVAKEALVLCGTEVLFRTFLRLSADINIKLFFTDGQKLKAGDIIASIEGPSRPILTGERTALNLLQRLSGIATRVNEAVEAVAGTNAVITDTRKTTPGLRRLEKYAVRVGGGRNHRMGLSDGILIKDNHIKAAGGIKTAVELAKKSAPHTIKIETEASDINEVREALEAGSDIIMLDNMSLEEMREAVSIIKGKALTEASGNMGDKNLREVAECGVDIISIGALTHTVRAADISLKFL